MKSASVENPEGAAALQISKSLVDTMNYYAHSVGIAAPQIGIPSRIVAVDARRAKRPCKNSGLLILANPEISAEEGKIVFREGCMSVPGFHAYVERAARIKVKAFDMVSKKIREFESEGFEAVVLQHEIDHLDGILFIDRKIVDLDKKIL